jgi:cytochrome c-type biogenesis protein
MEALFIELSRSVESAGWLALAASFLWGVAGVLLSPCHLAGIPLIVAYIGGQGQITTRRAFAFSLLFASGILLTIGVLGALGAAAGRLMGQAGGYVNYFVAAVFFLVGLNLLDVLPVPWSAPVGGTGGRRGFAAAFTLGLMFGAVLGPCTFAYMAPVLALTFKLAATNPVYGALLLTAFGLGHCSVIVAAGTSTGLVRRWLGWNERAGVLQVLRKSGGVLVLLAGLYLIYSAP